MKPKFKSAVAIIKHKNKYLLGLSTATDNRNNKWAFPGGRIEPGETPLKAAEREAFEETGVKCRAIKLLTFPLFKDVVYVACRPIVSPKLVPNQEFSVLGFYSILELRSLKLFDGVHDLILKVRTINV